MLAECVKDISCPYWPKDTELYVSLAKSKWWLERSVNEPVSMSELVPVRLMFYMLMLSTDRVSCASIDAS